VNDRQHGYGKQIDLNSGDIQEGTWIKNTYMGKDYDPKATKDKGGKVSPLNESPGIKEN